MHNESFEGPARAVDDVRLKLIEAIVRVRAVVACYNGELMKLAPHILFERRGDLFVSALTTHVSYGLGHSVDPVGLRLGREFVSHALP